MERVLAPELLRVATTAVGRDRTPLHNGWPYLFH
jgi:hypothetical protein